MNQNGRRKSCGRFLLGLVNIKKWGKHPACLSEIAIKRKLEPYATKTVTPKLKPDKALAAWQPKGAWGEMGGQGEHAGSRPRFAWPPFPGPHPIASSAHRAAQPEPYLGGWMDRRGGNS